MADAEKNARRRRAGLRLPESIAGLLGAMQAEAAGDPKLLAAWDLEQSPALMGALEGWTGDTNLADRLLARIVAAAWLAVRTGRDHRIRTEIGWMAGVARRARARIRRDERPIGHPLAHELQASVPDPLDELIRTEDRERVVRVIATLPERHRLAVTLRHIRGFSEADVAAAVERSFGIRFEGTRQILKDGREMVRIGLRGRNLSAEYPNRYARERKSENPAPKYTPPPLFREHRGRRKTATRSTRAQRYVGSRLWHPPEGRVSRPRRRVRNARRSSARQHSMRRANMATRSFGEGGY